MQCHAEVNRWRRVWLSFPNIWTCLWFSYKFLTADMPTSSFEGGRWKSQLQASFPEKLGPLEHVHVSHARLSFHHGNTVLPWPLVALSCVNPEHGVCACSRHLPPTHSPFQSFRNMKRTAHTHFRATAVNEVIVFPPCLSKASF